MIQLLQDSLKCKIIYRFGKQMGNVWDRMSMGGMCKAGKQDFKGSCD